MSRCVAGVWIAAAVCAVAGRVEAATLYVDASCAGPVPPYSTWATAASSITSAISAASVGDAVVVTNGSYHEAISIGKNLKVSSVNGPSATRLQDIYGLSVGSGCSLAGFTVSDGDGISCAADGVVSNCIVTGAWYAGGSGGGVRGGIVIDSILRGNWANGDGGGADGSVLYNCLIEKNGGNDGGGVSRCRLYNCVLRYNTTRNRLCYTLYETWCGYGQGGAARDSALESCTVVYNTAKYDGGGLFNCTASNSIVYYNNLNGIPNDLGGTGCLVLVCTPVALGGYTASGVLTNAPAFVDGEGWDVRPAVGSPCIDAGTNSAWMAGSFVRDGSPRVVDGDGDGSAVVDLGACEYHAGQEQLAVSAPSTVWPDQTSSVVVSYSADPFHPETRAIAVDLLDEGNNYLWFGGAATSGFAAGSSGTVTVNVPVVRSAHTATALVWSAFIGPDGDADHAFARRRQQPVQMPVATPDRLTMAGPAYVMASGTWAVVMTYTANAERVATPRDIVVNFLHPQNGYAWYGGTRLSGLPAGSGGSVTAFVALGISGAAPAVSTGYIWSAFIGPVGGEYDQRYESAPDLTVAVVTAIPAVSHYVSAQGSNVSPYTSWANAAHAIQDAVNVSLTGEIVRVSPGVYARFEATNAIAIVGECGAATTVIDNAGAGHVVLGSNTSLTGFTIKNGEATDYGMYLEGGGVRGGFIDHCILVSNRAAAGGGAYGSRLTDCQLLHNVAHPYGGGHSSNPGNGGGAMSCTLSNCLVFGNTADTGGGTLACDVRQSTIEYNSAGHGGGAYAYDRIVERCVVRHNTASGLGGGGIARGRVFDCLIQSNVSANSGGGAWNASLENCTVVDNQAASGGGMRGGTSVNSIVYYNVAPVGTNYEMGDILFTCTTPFTNAAGNIGEPPLFVGGHWLSGDSPCVNAGTNTAGVAARLDLGGHARLVGVAVDMGAYESPYLGGPAAEQLSYGCFPTQLLAGGTYAVTLGYTAPMTGAVDRMLIVNLLNPANGYSWHGGATLSGIAAGSSGIATAIVEVAGDAPVATTYIWSSFIGPDSTWQHAYRLVEQGGIAVTTLGGDGDGDDLPDLYEYMYSGTPTNMLAEGDMDGDGYGNIEECIAGTDPAANSSLLNVECRKRLAPGGTVYLLEWPSVSGRRYTVERATNLSRGFLALATNIMGVPPTNTFVDEVGAADAAYYYRLRVKR